jgi:hypothetical protein
MAPFPPLLLLASTFAAVDAPLLDMTPMGPPLGDAPPAIEARVASDADRDGFSVAEGDCDDNDPAVYPGHAEPQTADGRDNDCNCYIDDLDLDGDGFTSPVGADHYTGDCEEPDPERWDCDDSDVRVHPDRPEVYYDGIDQDCDGADACDQDGDGYDADPARVCPDGDCCPGGDDCNDRKDSVNPGADEGDAPDRVDNDCNGQIDDPFLDLDGDGYTAGEGDCWDSATDLDAKKVHPGALDVCTDLLDNDCNGLINDGCTNPQGFATIAGGGCASFRPGAIVGGLGLLLASLALCFRRKR